MRANLLPRSRPQLGAGRFAIDTWVVRDGTAIAAIIACVALLGTTIERARISVLQSEVSRAEARVGSEATTRERMRGLLLEVARYQELDREVDSARTTGPTVAATVARIGNAIPTGAWLTAMEPAAEGYRLNGGARSMERLGAVLARLDSSMAGSSSRLIEIDNRDAVTRSLSFRLQIGAASPKAYQ